MTIDVVIPVYNGAQFITQALTSVTHQTALPERIIVVDDGSTDATAQIVERFSSPVPLQLIRKANGGLSSARNAGIAASTSELVAFLDADDEWLPHKLETQIQIFNRSPYGRLGLVYNDYALIDTDGNPDMRSRKIPLNRHVSGEAFEKLLPANRILGSGSAVLIRRTVFDTVGTFDESLPYGEDWDMWLRIARVFQIDVAPVVLTLIRRHGKNMTSQKKSVFAGELSFFEKWIPLLKKMHRRIPLRWRLKVLYRLLSGRRNISLFRRALPVLLVPFHQSIFQRSERKSKHNSVNDNANR